ncbi:DUF2142 domain-containing protein [Methanobrevibacter sp. DSM 116169]|uniref:DUF2142 domain-containing protein n=1 Tax=Methanobrevibacter sp. DSM 116169 TaxID=3242727 RepID=UPI0038FCC4F1
MINKNDFLKNKEFILIYLLFLVFSSLILFNLDNYNHPKMEIIFLGILTIVGIFLIIYFSKNQNKIHKTAFLIILIFGILCVFSSPLLDVSDEIEHMARATSFSEGNLLPEYENIPNGSKITNTKDDSYNLNKKGYLLLTGLGIPIEYRHKTIFETTWDDEKITYEHNYVDSLFSQNPFYGYLAPAIGMGIAKLLDLNNIWMLWFGKLCNIILYTIICTLAIKITPVFKFPFLIFSCMPLAIYQSASFSIDAFIISFAILTIAYFFYLYKLPDRSITYKKILPFFIICLILGLSKVTLFILVLLVFLIPRNKFKENKDYYLSILSIFILIVLALYWTRTIASPNTYDSWRGAYFATSNINETSQISYIINNPIEFITTLFKSIFDVNQAKYLKFFTLGSGYYDYSSMILNLLYCVFLIAIILLYPNNISIKRNERIYGFLIFTLFITGTFLSLYLTWNPVGSLILKGVHTRYLIPIFALLPFIFTINKNKTFKNMDKYIMAIVIGFLASMILLIIANYY